MVYFLLIIVTLIILMKVIIISNGKKKHKHHSKPHIYISSILINNLKTKGKIMAFQLRDTDKVVGTLSPVDSKGFAAPVQTGSVTYKSSDDTVATVSANADNELQFTVVAGKPGTCQIQFSADADLGDGVTTIGGIADIEVLAGQAVSLSATFAEATPQ